MLLQGPVVEVRVQEVSLGNSRQLVQTARNAWQATVSLRPHLPLHIRGVVLVLRSPAAAQKPAKAARPRQPRKEWPLVVQLIAQIAIKLAFAAAPRLSVKVQQAALQLQVRSAGCDQLLVGSAQC